MPDLITMLYGENGPVLMIRGEDPAEIYHHAAEWVDQDGGVLSVVGIPSDVRVVSIRCVPSCAGGCDCGGPGRHYVQARDGSRGSFRGAFVELRYLSAAERGEAVHA